ncbi:hypothetical protein GW17_00018038 [Ensete ventricosum]|nr:hypothetical protein GW17_00018038 [Ensete ventricosum]
MERQAGRFPEYGLHLLVYRYQLKECDWTHKVGPKAWGFHLTAHLHAPPPRKPPRFRAVEEISAPRGPRLLSSEPSFVFPRILPPPAHANSSNLVSEGEVKENTRESIVTRSEASTERKLETLFASLSSDLSDQTGSTVRPVVCPIPSMSHQLWSRFFMLSFVPLPCGPGRITTLDVKCEEVLWPPTHALTLPIRVHPNQLTVYRKDVRKMTGDDMTYHVAQ